jgi:Flp pilus assembly protein TadG
MHTHANTPRLNSKRATRPQGMAILYLAILMVTLVAVCSLAVDFGRYELCKTEMQRAVDNAARAGAFKLATSYTVALSTATSVSNANYLEARTIGSNGNVTVSVQLLNWTNSSTYTVLVPATYNQANAVRVTMTYNVPLVFGAVIGIPTKPASRSATALLSVSSQSIYVGANGNIWLAGEPTGTQGSDTSSNWQGQNVNPNHPWQYDIAGPVGGTAADGEPYASPVQPSISLVQGALIMVSGVSGAGSPGTQGSMSNAQGALNGVTNSSGDDWAANNGSEHGIADVWMPTCAISAVFLGSAVPDGTAAPAALDFSTGASCDYSTLSPKVKQPFYVGTGQTSSSTQQTIIVPNGATRLFLGMMDNQEWSNNRGGYNATITQRYVQTVQ